jgi:hypothetical protein
MPKQKEHQRQIASNEAFYADINKLGQKYFDWRITTLFYIIVHYADALCAANGIVQISNHEKRAKELKKLLSPADFSLYLGLKDASRKARYEVGCLDKSANDYWQNVYRRYYHPLRTSLKNKIPK